MRPAARRGSPRPCGRRRTSSRVRAVRGAIRARPSAGASCAGAAGVAFAAGLFVFGFVAGLIAAAVAPALGSRALRARRERYRRSVEAGAADIAIALADALSGGHSLRGAITSAADSVAGPPGNELRRVAAELELGARTDDALEGMRRRIGSPAIDVIVAGALLQRRAGGDLAQLLRSSARAFEDELRLLGEVRAATAQARFTGLVVVLLPLGGAGLAELASPGFVAGLVSFPLSALADRNGRRDAGDGRVRNPPARPARAHDRRRALAFASALRRSPFAGCAGRCALARVRARAEAAAAHRTTPRRAHPRAPAAATRPGGADRGCRQPRRTWAGGGDGGQGRDCAARGAARHGLGTAAPGRLGLLLALGAPVAGFLAPDYYLRAPHARAHPRHPPRPSGASRPPARGRRRRAGAVARRSAPSASAPTRRWRREWAAAAAQVQLGDPARRSARDPDPPPARARAARLRRRPRPRRPPWRPTFRHPRRPGPRRPPGPPAPDRGGGGQGRRPRSSWSWLCCWSRRSC